MPAIRHRRRAFGDTNVAALPRKSKRYIKADPEQRGMYIRVMPDGPHTFVAVARDPYGKQVWTTLGDANGLKIDEARELARSAIKRVQAGLPGIEPPPARPDSVEVVCWGWFERVVVKGRFRTADEKKRIVTKYILPTLGRRVFTDIKRSDVAALLDHVEDAHGQHQADAVLDVLRSVASWVATRDDGYTPPFVRGMSRVPQQDRKRSRFLDDDELRAVWTAADGAGSFGALVKLLLLTAQRRGTVLNHLRWSTVDLKTGVWTIPKEERAKSHGGTLRLPKAALDIIKSQPRLLGGDHVLTATAVNGDRAKTRLDKASGVTGWTLHDLRRTARSLMSRAGVRPDIAERTLGHVRRGVEGTYDLHPFTDEKAEALAKLAALIEHILAGPSDGKNVVELRKREAVS